MGLGVFRGGRKELHCCPPLPLAFVSGIRPSFGSAGSQLGMMDPPLLNDAKMSNIYLYMVDICWYGWNGSRWAWIRCAGATKTSRFFGWHAPAQLVSCSWSFSASAYWPEISTISRRICWSHWWSFLMKLKLGAMHQIQWSDPVMWSSDALFSRAWSRAMPLEPCDISLCSKVSVNQELLLCMGLILCDFFQFLYLLCAAYMYIIT